MDGWTEGAGGLPHARGMTPDFATYHDTLFIERLLSFLGPFNTSRHGLPVVRGGACRIPPRSSHRKSTLDVGACQGTGRGTHGGRGVG